MKTNLIYCIPLYLFCAGCLLTLLYYFIKAIGLKRIVKLTLTGFLIISGVYIVVTSLFI